MKINHNKTKSQNPVPIFCFAIKLHPRNEVMDTTSLEDTSKSLFQTSRLSVHLYHDVKHQLQFSFTLIAPEALAKCC